MAERQELLVDLRLADNLSGPLAAAKAHLGGFATTAREADAGLGGLTRTLTSVAKVGAVAFIGFQALNTATGFIEGSVKAAEDLEASTKRLAASLQANVPNWDGNTEAIKRQIEATAALGFNDQETQQSIAFLVGATHDVTKAIEVQNVAMDLARFKGVDLQSATEALVKVEAGRYRLLQSLGINIKANATTTEALAAVERVAGGQAQQFGDTTAGAMKKAGEAVHVLQEQIGTQLLPVIKDAANALTNELVPGIEAVGRAASDVNGPLGSFLDALKFFAIGGEHANVILAKERELLRDSAVGLDGVSAAAQQAAHWADLNSAALGSLTAQTDSLADALTKARDAADAAKVSAEAKTIVDIEAAAAQAAYARSLDGTNAAEKADIEAAKQLQSVNDDGAVTAKRLSEAISTLKDTVQANTGLLLSDADAALYLARGLDAAGIAAQLAAAKIADFNRTSPINTTLPSGPADTQRQFSFAPGGDADALKAHSDAVQAAADEEQRIRDKAAADAKAAGDKALAEAKRRAQEEAAAYKDALTKAFDAVQQRDKILFDALHERHLNAIKDAERLAETKHTASLQAISDTLKEQEAANAAPVNAAEKALRDRENEQRRRDLVESLQAAQAAVQKNQDPSQTQGLLLQLRAATEALQNFDAQAVIDRLTVVQKGLDTRAQGIADAATTKAAAELQAAKDEAQKATDAETKAAAKRIRDFDAALKTLQERDLAAKKTPAEVQKDITALEARFGISTDRLGFHHITDPLIAAIKTIRIEPPKTTIVNHNQFFVTLNGRQIAAALASAQNPASTASVRTGAAGRTP